MPKPSQTNSILDLIILALFIISGAASGWFGLDLIPEDLLKQVLIQDGPLKQIAEFKDLRFLSTGLGAFSGILLGFFFQQFRKRFVGQIKTTPTDLLISRSLGLIIGLLLANLILAPILLIPLPKELFLAKPIAAILSNLFFGFLGYNLAEVHGRTLLRLFNPNSTEALLVAEGILTPASAKILDTSVIIDGRISGLLSCGLLEGKVIVAQTVIDELQQLADSSSNEKRSKGRRGLKILTELREKYGRRLVINSTKYEGSGTDDRLLKLTSDTGGTLITADFNLAQVAQVQELKIMNLSELVIALRPDVQPGESLNLKVVRGGKEESQGVGYLDDGTMVVIDGARELIGQRLEVIVTGALQTSTGRMIFAKPEKNQSPQKSKNSRPLSDDS